MKRIICTGLVIAATAAFFAAPPSAEAKPKKEFRIKIVGLETRPGTKLAPITLETPDGERRLFASRDVYLGFRQIDGLTVFTSRWRDIFGLQVILNQHGFERLSAVAEKTPDRLLGLVIEDRLVLAVKARDLKNRRNLRTEAVFTEKEIQELLRKFVAASGNTQFFRNETVVVGGILIFALIALGAFLGVMARRRWIMARRRRAIRAEEEKRAREKKTSPENLT